ncbi:hypothetical protein CEB3_c46670 [Peptococcaceae bacterium CEB3]|nr:hypothetical protein CEB3_c46670 [Peptococcaceae bacterium CEB3]
MPESLKPAGKKAASVQPARKKGLADSRGTSSGSAIALNGTESLARYKKRVAYDRTVILGE